MIPNDVLRRLRYSLRINDAGMLDLFRLAGKEPTTEQLAALLLREEEEGFLPCSDDSLRSFLDALIEQRRGKREGRPAPTETGILSNNGILRRVRIALNFKEADVIATLKAGGMDVSKSELSALFRRENHKHYKVCGDQLLRNFLHGLALSRANASDASDDSGEVDGVV